MQKVKYEFISIVLSSRTQVTRGLLAVPRRNKEAIRTADARPEKTSKQCTTDYHYHKYPVLQTDVRDIHPVKKAAEHIAHSAV